MPLMTRESPQSPALGPGVDDAQHRARIARLLAPLPIERPAPSARVLCGAVVHIEPVSGRVLRCTRDHGHVATDHDNLGSQVLADWVEAGGGALIERPAATPLGRTIATIASHIRSYEGVRQWRLERGLDDDAQAAWERAEALRLLVRTLGR